MASQKPLRRSLAGLFLAVIVSGGILTATRWSDIRLHLTVRKLRTGDEGEQHEAQARLERLGKRCLPIFRQLIDDPHPRVRYLAVDTLGRLGEEKDFRWLVRALGDCDSEVRSRAVQLLPRWKDSQTLTVLASLLRDSDAELRTEAVKELGKWKDEEVLPLLVAALNDEDENVVGFAVNHLGKLTGQRFGYKFRAPREEKQKVLARVRAWAASKGLAPSLPSPPPELAQLMTPRRKPAPEFSLTDDTKNSLQLNHYQGKVLLLNFFSPG